jgi:hypothetical protein
MVTVMMCVQVATKMDKRFAKAWVALGLALSAQVRRALFIVLVPP